MSLSGKDKNKADQKEKINNDREKLGQNNSIRSFFISTPWPLSYIPPMERDKQSKSIKLYLLEETFTSA
jgi:hypothetical protein